jgi:hypothetical protein
LRHLIPGTATSILRTEGHVFFQVSIGTPSPINTPDSQENPSDVMRSSARATNGKLRGTNARRTPFVAPQARLVRLLSF